MNKKNDDEDLEMDRDTSAPKDKMKKRIPRTLIINIISKNIFHKLIFNGIIIIKNIFKLK